METKYISIKEFQEKGFLAEANRQFFHPLGLALTVVVDDDDKEDSIVGVQDWRDDPEGGLFGFEVPEYPEIEELRKSKIKVRVETGLCDEDGIQIKY